MHKGTKTKRLYRILRAFVTSIENLGRSFGFTDEELGNEILTAAKVKQYAVSEFIQSPVQRDAFKTG